jgi:hypothetical protein
LAAGGLRGGGPANRKSINERRTLPINFFSCIIDAYLRGGSLIPLIPIGYHQEKTVENFIPHDVKWATFKKSKRFSYHNICVCHTTCNVYTHTLTCTHTHISSLPLTHTHIYVCACMCESCDIYILDTDTRIHTHTKMHISAYAYEQISHTHTQTNTHTHTHTHTHMHALHAMHGTCPCLVAHVSSSSNDMHVSSSSNVMEALLCIECALAVWREHTFKKRRDIASQWRGRENITHPHFAVHGFPGAGRVTPV